MNKTIVFSFVVGDLFHYGHLRLLRKAAALGDYHICGVLTDKAVASYKRKPIQSYDERKAIISELRCVDLVVKQNSRDPTECLKKIHKDHPGWEIILVHGSDWKDNPFPGEEFLNKINGKVVLIPYWKKLSTTKIIKEIQKRD